MSSITITCLVILFLLIATLMLLRFFAKEEITNIASLFWLIWCWGYVIRWRLKFAFQNNIGQTAAWFIFLGSFYIFLEFLIISIRYLAGSNEGEPDAALISLPHLPVQIEVILLFFATIVLIHHWREWKLRKKEASTPPVVNEIIGEWRKHSKREAVDDNSKLELFNKSMKLASGLLVEGRKKQEVTITIMRAGEVHDQLLTSRAYPPNTPNIYRDLVLSIKDSAAGAAYKSKSPIYIPSTRHRAGINMRTFRSAGLAYLPIEGKDLGPSLMCVPLLDDDKVIAILNVSSNRRNAFEPLDFSIMALIGTVLLDEI
ncbi:hypothetical protein D3C76_922860 [compost metagenome]